MRKFLKKHKHKNMQISGYKRENIQLWVLCLPGIIKVFVFSYIPMVWLLLAFKFYIPSYGLFGSPFEGFYNFELLFSSGQALLLIKNAITINVLNIFVSTLVAVLIGLFMHELAGRGFLKFSQMILIMPFFVSWPLVGLLLKTFIGEGTGMLASILSSITGSEAGFYKKPELWPWIIMLSYVWKTAGMSGITYFAVLMGVDKSPYEAAQMDGAGTFKVMWHISLPVLKLMIILNIIMSSINILKVDFNMVYYLTEGNAVLYATTDVIETFMFRATQSGTGLEQGTAIGLIQGLFGLILTLSINKVCKKFFRESLF